MSSEQHPNYKWELIKSSANYLRTSAEFAAKDLIDDIKYKSLVNQNEHERASVITDVFTSEVLDFLKVNPSGKLKTLQPTKEQLAVVNILLNSVTEETLLLRRTMTGVYKKKPFLAKIYDTKQPEEENIDIYSQVQHLLNIKKSSIAVRWDVRNEYPLGFDIYGEIGTTFPKRISFLVLPQKAETPEQVKENLWNKDSNIGVYQDGERIIINNTFTYKGREHNTTDQYYLIDAFDGEGTNKTYWLYGSNEDKQHKISVREKIDIKEMAFQNSTNK